MSYVKLNLEQYPRRQHLEYFSSLQYPYVGVTVNMDVTALLQRCKRENISFYLLFLHAAALAADSVPELRQRLHKGDILQYDQCPTSHIELLDDGTYCYCTLRHHMPLSSYLRCADVARAKCRARGSIEEDEAVESMYFISTVPWLHYTSLLQPMAGGEDSNPRITWGRFQADSAGRLQMPVTLLAHHGLVDGLHIAQFYDNLKKQVDTLAF